jgi:hypothetical protein
MNRLSGIERNAKLGRCGPKRVVGARWGLPRRSPCRVNAPPPPIDASTTASAASSDQPVLSLAVLHLVLVLLAVLLM